MGVFGSSGLNLCVWLGFREFISLANVPLCHFNTLLSWPMSHSIESLPITTQHIWFMQDFEEGRIITFCYWEHWIDYAYSVDWREAINLQSHYLTRRNNLYIMTDVCGMQTNTHVQVVFSVNRSCCTAKVWVLPSAANNFFFVYFPVCLIFPCSLHSSVHAHVYREPILVFETTI